MISITVTQGHHVIISLAGITAVVYKATRETVSHVQTSMSAKRTPVCAGSMPLVITRLVHTDVNVTLDGQAMAKTVLTSTSVR